MMVAVNTTRGYGAANTDIYQVEADSTIEALRRVLADISVGGLWKPGTYISCVAFVLSNEAESPAPSGSMPQCLPASMPSPEFPSLAAQAGTKREAPPAAADTTCLSGPAGGETFAEGTSEKGQVKREVAA